MPDARVNPVSDGRGNLVLKASGNPLLEHDQFGRNYLFDKKSFQANLSEVESCENDSEPKRKEADKLEFSYRHVTRFRLEKQHSYVKCSQARLTLDTPPSGWQRSTK